MKTTSDSLRGYLGIFTLLCVLGLTTTLIGCKSPQDIQTWFTNTHKLQTEARLQAAIVPYRVPQHQALKNYFSELSVQVLALKNNSELAAHFNSTLAKKDFEQLCAQLLIPASEWQSIIRHCTKNRFFLCSEEVRAYPTVVTTLRGQLTPALQARFDQASSCHNAVGSHLE